MVREIVGPVAAFRISVKVSALPRTRSGKTARKTMADLAAGKEIAVRWRENVRGLVGRWLRIPNV